MAMTLWSDLIEARDGLELQRDVCKTLHRCHFRCKSGSRLMKPTIFQAAQIALPHSFPDILDRRRYMPYLFTI